MGIGDIRTGTLALPCHLDVVGHGQLGSIVLCENIYNSNNFLSAKKDESGRKKK